MVLRNVSTWVFLLTLAIAAVRMSDVAVAQESCSNKPASAKFVPVTGRLLGIIIDDACRYVYAANYDKNLVEVFDLSNLTVVAEIPVGSRPTGIDTSPDGKTLYVANAGGTYISIVDIAQRAEIGRVEVPGDVDPARINSSRAPYSIATAANGHVFFTTTFGGSGSGRVLEFDPATGGVKQRAVGTNGYVTESTRLKASGDRTVIGVVMGNISSGPVARYTLANDKFSEKKLATSVGFIGLDRTGSIIIVNSGSQHLDPSLSVHGRVTGLSTNGYGVAVDPSGTTAYQTNVDRIEVLDLATHTKSGELKVGDDLKNLYISARLTSGNIAISRDGSLLVVTTDHGLSVLAADKLMPAPAALKSTAYSSVHLGNQSFLRFHNKGGRAGTVRVTLADLATGQSAF